MTLFRKKISFYFLFLSSIFILTTTNKNFPKFKISASTKTTTNAKQTAAEIKKQLEKLEKSKKTTYDFVLDLVRKNKTDGQIIYTYYSTPKEVLATLIMNDYRKINEDKAKKKEDEANKKKDKSNEKEQKRVEDILKKIKEKEAEFVKKHIELPRKENKNKPIVIVNPGFGFNEPGAVVSNPNYKKNIVKKLKKPDLRKMDISLFQNVEETRENFKKIPGKIFNQLMSYELVLKLLKANYEVYLVYDFVDLFETLNLKLPKDNPSLHILFNTRPPIKGYGNPSPCRVADADAFCISEIFKYLEEKYNKKYKKDPKMCSVCIHHDSSSNIKARMHGFVPFYRKPDKITSATLSKNSKKLAQIMLNHCKNVNKLTGGKDVSRVATEEWVVCGPGKEVKNAAAILIEVGHLENPSELKLMLNPKKREQMAIAMEKAIAEYFNKEK